MQPERLAKNGSRLCRFAVENRVIEVSGADDHRQVRAFRRKPAKNVSSRHLRHVQIEQDKIDLVIDNEENRELIRQEIEKLSTGAPPPEAQVPTLETSEDELERRIMSALAKERGTSK